MDVGGSGIVAMRGPTRGGTSGLTRRAGWLVLAVLLTGCAPQSLVLWDVAAVTPGWSWIDLELEWGDDRADPIETSDAREPVTVPLRIRQLEIRYNQLMDLEASREHIVLETEDGVPVEYELWSSQNRGFQLAPVAPFEDGTTMRLTVGAGVTSWFGHTQDQDVTARMTAQERAGSR